MKHISIRFLIGLGDPSGETMRARLTSSAREQAASYILGRAYDVGGLYSGTGYWLGQPEPCIMFETIQPDSETVRAHAKSVARRIRERLEQDAVGLVFTPCTFELI